MYSKTQLYSFDNPHSTIKIVKDIRMLLFRKK